MTDDTDDELLRARFAELRAHEQGTAPRFDAMPRRTRWRRVAVALVATNLFVAVAAAVLVIVTHLAPPPPLLRGVDSPAPTAFLVHRPSLPGESR